MVENGNYYLEQPLSEEQGVGQTWGGGNQLENTDNSWRPSVPLSLQWEQQYTPVESFNGGQDDFGANAGNFFRGAGVKRQHGELSSPNAYLAKGFTAENALAETQTHLQRLGNGVLQAGTIAVGTLIGNTAGMLAGLVNGVASAAKGEGFVQGFTEQGISKGAQAARKWAQEAMPVFHSKGYDDASVIGKAFHNEFWADLMAQAGFTVGAAGSVAAYTALAVAAGVPTGGAGTVGMLSAGAIALLASVGEATVEALASKQENEQAFYSELTRQYNEAMANASTAQEYSDISAWYQDQSAKTNDFLRKQQNRQFGLNIAVLGVSNAMMFSRMMSRGAKATAAAVAQKTAVTDLQKAGASAGEIASGLSKARTLQRAANAINEGRKVSVLRDAAGRPIQATTRTAAGDYARAGLEVAKTALSEGGEEWSQGVISGEWQRDPSLPDFYGSVLDEESIEKADSLISAYFATMAAAFQDPDAWQEAFMGAMTGLLGVPGGGTMSFREGRLSGRPSWDGGLVEAARIVGEGRERRSSVEAINQMLEDDGFRKQYEALVGSITDEGLALASAQVGDKFDFENYRHRGLVRLLLAADDLGITEKIYGPMADAMQQISEEEVEQMRADGLISYTGTAKDFVEKTRNAGAERRVAIENILDTKADLLARYGGSLSDEAMGNIIYGQMQIDNWAKRRSEIGESANDLLDKFIVSENGSLEYNGSVISLGEEFDKLSKEQKQNYIDNLRFSVKQALWLNGELETKLKDDAGNSVKINVSELRGDLAAIFDGIGLNDASRQERDDVAEAIRDIDKINDSIKSFSDKIKEYEHSPQRANADIEDIKQKKAENKESKEKTKRVLSAKESLQGKNSPKEVRQAIPELKIAGFSDDEISSALTDPEDGAIKAFNDIVEKREQLLNTIDSPAAAQVVIALANEAESAEQLSQMLRQEATIRKAIDDAFGSNIGEALREELSRRDEAVKKLFADYDELRNKADKVAEAEEKRQEIASKIAKQVEEEFAHAEASANEQAKAQEQLEKDLEGIRQEEEQAAEKARREGKLLPAGNDPSPDASPVGQNAQVVSSNEQSDGSDTIADTEEKADEEYAGLKGTRKPLAFFQWKEYKKNSHTKKTIKDNPALAAVAKYYEEKGIKETVDSGKVHVGDRLSIMVDTKAKDGSDKPIIVYVKTSENGEKKVVGIFQATRRDSSGIALRDEILAKYEKEANANDEFFDTGYRCTVQDITRGKLNYGGRGSRHDIGEIAVGEGLTYGSDFSIGFIGARNGRNTIKYASGISFKKAIGNSPSGMTEAKHNGMPVAIIKDVYGGFKFAPIAVERFNAKWYKANQNSSMARRIDTVINRYIAATGEEWKHAADDLENLLYLGNQNLRFRLAKKSDGTFYFYEQSKENGEWITDKIAPIHPFTDADSMRSTLYKLMPDGVQFNITERALELHGEDLLESHCLVGEIESLKSHYVEFGVSEAFQETPPGAVKQTEQEEDDALEEPDNSDFEDDFSQFFEMEEGLFMEYDESGERVDIEKESAAIQQMLGNIDVEYTERLSSMSGQEKSGMYHNGHILIGRHGNRGVMYHEAFHYVVDKLLTEEEKNGLFKACEGSFSHADGSPVKLSEKKLLEEYLAEEFREFVMDRETLVGRIRSSVKEFFGRLYDFLVGIDNVQRNNREAVYRDIMQGRWQAEQSSSTPDISEMERDALRSAGLSDQTMELLSEADRQAALDCIGF